MADSQPAQTPQSNPGHGPPANFQQLQQQYQAAYGVPPQYAPQFAAHYGQPQQMPQMQQSQQPDQLRAFWQGQMLEVEQVGNDPAEFKNHQLPLARIKKIMKSDEDVRMISAEAPVLFAKACEMFILELTLRSWNHAEENKRRTLQRNDIAAAITKTDIFDFLVDIVPREDIKPEGAEGGTPPAGTVPPGTMPMPRPPQAAPHPAMAPMFYPYPMPPQGGDPNMMRPPLPMDPAIMYQQQQYMQGLAGQQWAQQMAQNSMQGPPGQQQQQQQHPTPQQQQQQQQQSQQQQQPQQGQTTTTTTTTTTTQQPQQHMQQAQQQQPQQGQQAQVADTTSQQ